MGQFDAELFSMANKTEYLKNDNYTLSVGERYEVNVNGQFRLNGTPVAHSMSIAGLTETDEQTPGEGEFTVKEDPDLGWLVTINVTGEDAAQWVGKTIEVVYDKVQPAYEAIITNKEAAIGEATAKHYGLAA